MGQGSRVEERQPRVGRGNLGIRHGPLVVILTTVAFGKVKCGVDIPRPIRCT
ncbi:MAG: hypothetical protein WCO67_27195 [Betaproteobacteria bacterium]